MIEARSHILLQGRTTLERKTRQSVITQNNPHFIIEDRSNNLTIYIDIHITFSLLTQNQHN